MSGNLDNFPNGWKSGKFPKFLKYLNVFYFSIKGNFYFRNFQKYTQSPIRIKEIPFSQCLGIWEISKMPGNLGNFPNSLENLMVISQMHSYSWNFPNTQTFVEFPKYPVIWVSRILKIYHPQIHKGIWEILRIPQCLAIFFKSIIAVGSWQWDR